MNAELRTRRAGFTLIEMLVYFGLFSVVTGVALAAFYRCMDYSTALRRSTEAISRTLQAGEHWRADVRAARGPVRLATNATDQVLQLTGPGGPITYRFATNSVFRRVGNNGWTRVLDAVEVSSFLPDHRGNVEAWRWELELKTGTKKISRVRPLFTFIAVPTGESTK